MRYFALAQAGLLLALTVVVAQQPPAATPPLDPSRNRLDALLLKWQDTMQKIDTLAAKCERSTLDKAFNNVDIFVGSARYMRPDMADLHMAKKNKPEVYERFLCTGTFLYEFAPATKEVRVHQLPPRKAGQIADDNFLSFLFGMKAEEAKRRYDLQLEKEDQYWIYLRIFPRYQADKADFKEAQLVLAAPTFLPRRLWFQQPNGNEVTWEITEIDPKARLNRNDFVMQNLQQGWKLVQAPQVNPGPAQGNGPPPRVVRPQGQ